MTTNEIEEGAHGATMNARAPTMAHGTWKKTIRDDSPRNPCAGFGQRKAAAIIEAMKGSRSPLSNFMDVNSPHGVASK